MLSNSCLDLIFQSPINNLKYPADLAFFYNIKKNKIIKNVIIRPIEIFAAHRFMY